MKNSICLTAIGTTLLAATNLQALELHDWYITTDAGAALLQDSRIKSDVSHSGGWINYDPGIRGGLAVGASLSDLFAVELESAVMWNPIDTIADDTPSSSSSLTQIPVLGNFIYKIPFKGSSTPYIGGGVGGVVSFLDLHTPLGNVNEADFTVGYQAFAGWKFRMSDHLDFGLAYKFMGTFNHDWSDNQITFKTGGAYSHSFLLNLTWKF
jgi:opacity protein-like surface antigen